jgi:hypothetical protein
MTIRHIVFAILALAALAAARALQARLRPYCRRNALQRHRTVSFVCPCCVRPISMRWSFCRHCRSPISSYAATGPIESILAQGEVYRRAVRSSRRIAIVGLWFLAAPSLAALLLGAGAPQTGFRAERAVVFLFGVLPLAIALRRTISPPKASECSDGDDAFLDAV